MIDEAARRAALHDAEDRALALLDAIEAAGLIAAGRSERAVERDIARLAAERFGIARHWHKRIVRAGPNTLAIAADTPADRIIADDDMVFLDLGPVFEDGDGAFEADVGRSYAIGDDPAKHALCRDLPIQFDAVARAAAADPDLTGAALYDIACRSAAAAGWRFGGAIAGHIVGEFPHAHLPDDKAHGRIAPGNPTRLRDPDAFGRVRHWIIEIHLIAPDDAFGGFYERLLR